MKKLPFPDESKLETYERRQQLATFDRLDLTCEFMAGRSGIGAVVKKFLDAILAHDVIVKVVEEKWRFIDEVRREFNKRNRLFRNMDSAWTCMNQRPDDFSEYVQLLPRMKNIEERLKLITDSAAKVKAEAEYQRYKELQPVCALLVVAYNALEDSRTERDAARADLVKAEAELHELREQERLISLRISDDHIVADEKKMTVATVFPNIQGGLILCSINDKNVENLSFDECVVAVRNAKSPHKAVFKRYDYRYNPFLGEWNSLQELRELGVCVDDPMLARADFVNLAGSGDMTMVKNLLLSGTDPNVADYTGCTAFFAAAVNRKSEIVELLHRAGAYVDCRDKNMMTPFLACVQRGYMDIIRQLVEFGADKTTSDKNNRNAAYFSLFSGNLIVVKQFVKRANCNEAESLWDYTPLHLASTMGNIALGKVLIEIGSSIYRKCKKGNTPEQVAREAGHLEMAKYLEEERLGAPAQLVYEEPEIEIEIWIGDLTALDPIWITDVGITEAVCLMRSSERPANMAWLQDDDYTRHLTTQVDALDDDDSEDGWMALKLRFPQIMQHLLDIMKKGGAKILICDPTGNSNSAAVVCALLLIRSQIRVNDGLQSCYIARPCVRLSGSLRRGLEELQREFDKKRLKRLDHKIRTAVVMSTAF